jgi:hypothetical protein
LAKKRKQRGSRLLSELTRRSFLKGVGITAAGSTVLSSGVLTHAADTVNSRIVGPGAVSILLVYSNIHCTPNRYSRKASLRGSRKRSITGSLSWI